MIIPIKIVLSRLPIAYSVFRKFSIFKHGAMIDPRYAYGVAHRHYSSVESMLEDDFTVLELGPGDSLISALNMTAFGAKKCYMVDVGEYATMELEVYKQALSYLEEKGWALPK